MKKGTKTSSLPLISVIIPARNRAELIKRTLASVRAQSYRPFSVILIDNDSTDKTLDVMEKWRDDCIGDLDVKVISEPRHGAPAARNAGAAISETEWITFFDSDDEMKPNHIADFVAAITENPNADIIGRGITIKSLSGKIINKKFPARHLIFNQLFHSILATPRYAVRQDIFQRSGGWDNRAWGWNDYELGVRLLLMKPEVITLTGSSVITYRQADSITGTGFSNSPRKWEDTIDLCVNDLLSAGRSDLTGWLDVYRIILAAEYAREGAHSEARRLRMATIAKSGTRLRLNLLYLQHRLMGRGTAQAAMLLFPRRPRD